MHPTTRLPLALQTTARRYEGLLPRSLLRDHGISPTAIRGLVARGDLRRVTRGVYLVADAPIGPDTSRRRAAWTALLAHGPTSIAVGACALALHGVPGLPTTIRPEAALPDGAGRRHRDGIALRQFDDGMRVEWFRGHRLVSLEWAIAQAIPELHPRSGLAVLDAVLHGGRLTRERFDHAHDLARGRRGIGARHPLWDLADHRAESPLESFARWECVDQGIPPDVLQLPITDDEGRVVARGDMAWRRGSGRWLVVELDGEGVHGAPDAVFRDRHRQNRLVGSGRVDLLRFTFRDIGRVAATVRGELRRPDP